jgi:hypothetical protein
MSGGRKRIVGVVDRHFRKFLLEATGTPPNLRAIAPASVTIREINASVSMPHRRIELPVQFGEF